MKTEAQLEDELAQTRSNAAAMDSMRCEQLERAWAERDAANDEVVRVRAALGQALRVIRSHLPAEDEPPDWTLNLVKSILAEANGE